jgi:glyoxylase-like metal-dependent hydrolase (beta-lactamase superfamily II)
VTIRRVPVPFSTRAPTGETAAYVVGDSDALVVDPAAWTDDLAATARDADASHVAVTHNHPDHVGGVADAAAALGLTVWARAARAPAFEASTDVAPDRTFRSGETLPAGSGIGILDTPGHAPEHVSFSTPDGLVCGDLAVAEGSVVVGAPEGDMRAYLSSLRRVHARNPARLYPGHGPVIDEPRVACRRLLDHRLDRERKVAAAVRDGASTPDQILDMAYDKDISDVHDLARATVVAHLEKLAVEGRVRWDGTAARPP